MSSADAYFVYSMLFNDGVPLHLTIAIPDTVCGFLQCSWIDRCSVIDWYCLCALGRWNKLFHGHFILLLLFPREVDYPRGQPRKKCAQGTYLFQWLFWWTSGQTCCQLVIPMVHLLLVRMPRISLELCHKVHPLSFLETNLESLPVLWQYILTLQHVLSPPFSSSVGACQCIVNLSSLQSHSNTASILTVCDQNIVYWHTLLHMCPLLVCTWVVCSCVTKTQGSVLLWVAMFNKTCSEGLLCQTVLSVEAHTVFFDFIVHMSFSCDFALELVLTDNCLRNVRELEFHVLRLLGWGHQM